MKDVVLDNGSGVRWVDLVDPTAEELRAVGEAFGIEQSYLQDCMEPSHLPKHEELEAHHFLILRHADLDAYPNEEADTVRELTRKIALFFSKETLVTVRRQDVAFVSVCKNHARARAAAGEPNLIHHCVLELTQEVFRSYSTPIRWVDKKFEEFEALLLSKLSDASVIENVYFLKRKVAVLRRVLSHDFEMFLALRPWAGNDPYVQDVRESGEKQIFFANELEDDAEHLLTTYLSLSAHRTNEIVRVLTIFSVFFLPLTFIVGVYGMNFRFMPELESPWGYPAVWVAMVVVCMGLYFWFHRRGWMR